MRRKRTTPAPSALVGPERPLLGLHIRMPGMWEGDAEIDEAWSMENNDLDYGAAVCAITIEAVARAAAPKDSPL